MKERTEKRKEERKKKRGTKINLLRGKWEKLG
jgi:hypothetical protein